MSLDRKILMPTIASGRRCSGAHPSGQRMTASIWSEAVRTSWNSSNTTKLRARRARLLCAVEQADTRAPGEPRPAGRWRRETVRGGASGERRLQLLLELLLGVGADHRLLQLAVLEQHQRRDRHDVELDRGLLVVVDVELDDLERLALLGRDLLDDRGDAPAGPTPWSPEVDEHGHVGLEHLCL